MKVSEIPKAFLPPGGFYLKLPNEILLRGVTPPTPPGRDAPAYDPQPESGTEENFSSPRGD